jgi:dephospho-CoA kinase
MLMAELKDYNADTVVRRYVNERSKAIKMLEKTFDTQLKSKDGIVTKIGSL